MIVSLAVVVFCSSIAVFFSDELGRFIKKIVAIPGIKLLVPLVIVSWLIEKYTESSYWLLIWFQALFLTLISFLERLLPFEIGAAHFAKMIYLFLLACLPAWVFWLMAKRKGLDASWPKPYRLGVALWVIAAILLTVR